MEHLVVYVERYHKLSNHQASAFVYFLDRTPHWGISLWRLNKNTLLSWLPWHYLLIGASDVSETERMWEFHRQTGRDKTGLPTHRNMNSFIKKKKNTENKTCFIIQTRRISQPVLMTFSLSAPSSCLHQPRKLCRFDEICTSARINEKALLFCIHAWNIVYITDRATDMIAL